MKSIGVVAAAIGVVVGAFVSSITIVVNGWRQRIADTKRHRADTEAANVRHLRELALEAAIADWKHHLDAAEKWTPSTHQRETDRPEVDPFDYFLIKKLKVIQTFGDGTISTADLPRRFDDMKEFLRFFRPKRKSRNTDLDEQNE